MAWNSDARKKRLPKNWASLRAAQLRRDNSQCQWISTVDGSKCLKPANQVDHIVAMADDHANLQSLCEWHHSQKSAREGAEARAKKLAENDRRFRREEIHPGLL